MKKVVIFARVSTSKQEEEGLSLNNQLYILRTYAKDHNFEVIKEFVYSESADQKIRKKFDEMISYIKNSDDIFALIAYRVDRITRNFRDAVLIDDLRLNFNKEIHFVYDRLVISKKTVGRDIQDWDTKVFLAKQYINRLKEDAVNSASYKVRNGEWPGKAPFGYINRKREDGKNWIFPEPFESKIVKRIYEWYSNQKYSMDQIRKNLNTNFDTSFHKSKIERILKNPFYHGKMKYDGKIYPHKYEIIISKDQFDTVQKIKEGHQKKHIRLEGLPYLYRGLIKCSKCGCTFTPEKKKQKYIYYHCTEFYGKHDTSWIREESLTEQFAEIFKGIQIPKEIAEGIAKTLKESHESKIEFYETQYLELQKKHLLYENRIEKMYDDYLDGCITKDMYDKKHQKFREEQHKIKHQMDNLQTADEEYYITANYILSLANRAYDLFLSSEPDIKRQLLKLVLQNCEIDNGSLRYTLNYPFSAIFDCVKRSAWLPGQDSNLQPSG